MSEKSYLNCFCHTYNYSGNNDDLLKEFKSIRYNCPAIKEIFIPDDFYGKFLSTLETNKSSYDFIILLAFERGYLKNITRPIHKFLLGENGSINPNMKITLLETWITDYKSSRERNQKSKQQFLGHLHELLFADWLDENDYSIIDLEALGAKNDIIAKNNKGKTIGIEVKYIGYEEWFCDKLHNKNNDFSPDLNYQHDNLLYIAFTAADQLCKKSNQINIISILLQNINHFDLDWINWHNPSFHSTDAKERPFINKKKYTNISNEVRTIFRQIDEIWFFKIEGNFTYNLIRTVNTRVI